MCDICLHSPCLPRCPNYDDSKDKKTYCLSCGELITVGDEVISLEKEKGGIGYCCDSVCATDYLLSIGVCNRCTFE